MRPLWGSEEELELMTQPAVAWDQPLVLPLLMVCHVQRYLPPLSKEDVKDYVLGTCSDLR